MLLSIANDPRDYAWGSTTLLAALEGRAPSASPEAEVWFGDHPGDPADVSTGGTLDAVTGGSLPYLLKLLAAADPLSIQVHPTREQAREGFARETGMDAGDPARNYRDANHKPELIVALSDRFEALAGLRPIAETQRLLASLPDSDGAREVSERLGAGDEATALRATIGWLLSGDAADEVAEIIAGLRAAESAEFADALHALRGIAERCPDDPGVVVAMLMNFVVLAPGEAIFLRAGLLHAYVSGLGVEIMAASDNVLRGGLTPKHIDIDELLAIVDTTPGVVSVQPSSGEVTTYDVPVSDFALRRVLVDGEYRAEVSGPTMVLATRGELTVSGVSDAGVPVAVGRAVFATADEPELLLRGTGEAFIAQPGAVV
ncbi:mannose-6-phosphate isomerase, class I [Microbacterium esteraromaticum]|uniref:mannose-6-phosphate isomerase, class I n=1 Tax=Microbacterium esteraromaticum TaxID=57043 RepID=UPI00195CAAA9|nr:mannose-6-phosphate isomerase, class I [Microbacterium esteraromaticum]MBM7467125.1 mannose-6-phosphate isomerase [Microbacterium esteraromaticum]